MFAHFNLKGSKTASIALQYISFIVNRDTLKGSKMMGVSELKMRSVIRHVQKCTWLTYTYYGPNMLTLYGNGEIDLITKT
jgi:hypothetical protein